MLGRCFPTKVLPTTSSATDDAVHPKSLAGPKDYTARVNEEQASRENIVVKPHNDRKNAPALRVS